jgi:hypothetical protein
MTMDVLESTHGVTCPPHHWLIGNLSTEHGTVERWSCQRCDAVRDRLLSRRRFLSDSDKRVIGAETSPLEGLLGYGGERVA